MPSHTRHNYRSCIDVSTLKSEVETIRVDVVSGIAYYNEHKGHKRSAQIVYCYTV